MYNNKMKLNRINRTKVDFINSGIKLTSKTIRKTGRTKQRKKDRNKREKEAKKNRYPCFSYAFFCHKNPNEPFSRDAFASTLLCVCVPHIHLA